MKIGDIIKSYRIAHGLSQRSFAQKCGVSFGYISMLESGKGPRDNKPLVPALTVLNKLAIGMGITIDHLIEQADDMDISLAPPRVNNDLSSDYLAFANSLSTEKLEVLVEITAAANNLSVEDLKKVLSFVQFLSKEE